MTNFQAKCRALAALASNMKLSNSGMILAGKRLNQAADKIDQLEAFIASEATRLQKDYMPGTSAYGIGLLWEQAYKELMK